MIFHIFNLDLLTYSSQSYHAKISDFGLAKMGPMADRTHVSTQIMGTYGYAAPEYVATGKYGITILVFDPKEIRLHIVIF